MKRLLFVCVENSCRSQMAEGFAKALAGGGAEVFSAGSRPSGIVNERAAAVMKEAGIDIGGHRSKGLAELPYTEFDCVVTMGCGDACPGIRAGRHINLQIPDPKDKDMDFFRSVREQIRGEVAAILNDFIIK